MIELKHEADNQTLRSNGRKFFESRAIQCQLGIMKNPNIAGSALFQIGNTKVAAFLNGPHQVSKSAYSPLVVDYSTWRPADVAQHLRAAERNLERQVLPD